MKRNSIIIVVIFIIAVASPFLLTSKGDAEKAALIILCSDMTKGMMKSPGSYIMDFAKINVKDGNTEEGANGYKSASVKNAILSGEMPYRVADVLINYESKNPFGVSLAGNAYCRYSMIGSAGSASYKILSVNINDMNLSEIDIMSLSDLREYKINENSYFNRIKYLLYKIKQLVN